MPLSDEDDDSDLEIIDQNMSQSSIELPSTSKSLSVSTQANHGLRPFLDTMKRAENDELDQLLSKAIYSSGAPLSMVENDDWVAFFQKLRPSYKLPSRYQISHKLMDGQYESINEVVSEKISQASILGLQCDAWSNQRNESYINIIITTPAPVFFRTFSTKTERHMADYMAKMLEDVICEIGVSKFGAVVSKP